MATRRALPLVRRGVLTTDQDVSGHPGYGAEPFPIVVFTGLALSFSRNESIEAGYALFAGGCELFVWVGLPGCVLIA